MSSDKIRIGINGFGRMGRLALRAAAGRDDVVFVAINDPGAPLETFATLLEFDSVQGRFARECHAVEGAIEVGGQVIPFVQHESLEAIPWQEWGVDLVLECTGKFRKRELLQPHLDNGASRVLVSAPVMDGPPNIVVGVNHEAVDYRNEPVITAASCTTNCLAPIVKTLHDAIGIDTGLITTIHSPTNTQTVLDGPHKDPRRARAAQLNLIPTSTNSATAVGLIVPELAGRLDAIAVRAPVFNSSITDCAFQMLRATSVGEANAALAEAAAAGPLRGILGYETRPLVSSDFVRDPRSAIVDATSTRLVGDRMLKVLAFYDNEFGYANRMVELAVLAVGQPRESTT